MKFAATLATALATATAATVSAEPVSYDKYRTDIADFNWNRANAIVPLVLGGTEVPVGTAQFVAGMRNLPVGESFCGGSLIHPKWILTAAHCGTSIVYVNVGTHFRSGDVDGSIVKVKRKIQHPSFWTASTGHDFLLLELASEVSYPSVRLASADRSDEAAGTTATVMGWGDTSQGGPGSELLLKVDVDIVSDDECTAFLGRSHPSMLCAGGKLNEDGCQGDSGGPLVVNKNGTTTLVGVVSWGIGCGNLGFPGIYARVSWVRDFIDQYVPQVKWT